MGDSAMAERFMLRAELQGHEADVRGTCGTQDARVVTCSRDKSVRIWTPTAANTYDAHILLGHQHFVSCVLAIPPSDNVPSGAILSGGHDRTMSGQTIVAPVINVWVDGNLAASLEGHTLTICDLALAADGRVYSASWDKTVRIWDLASMSSVGKLEGHEQAVWSVLPIEDGGIITASADKTIKLWRDGACKHTYVGHTDCVRALALFPNVGFVSAGNDGTVMLWAVSGECLMKKAASDTFIYSVAVLPTLEVLTSGEDKTCKVWRDGDCVCSLPHPGSVWSVSTTSEGDIITGCSDGIARVWTRAAERQAAPEVQRAYEAQLAGQTISAQEVGGVNKDNVEGPEGLLVPGKKDGATKLIKDGNKVKVYSWNGGENKWDEFGTVVDGPGEGGGGGGKGVFEGKEYDKVFDIEIDEGVTLKCGYNYGENPYSVAQEFIWNHDLSQENLTQIAEFIDKNANQGVTLGMDMPTSGADPLTGAHNAMHERSAAPPSAQSSSQSTISFESSTHLPKKAMIFFVVGGKVEVVEKKLKEFNEQLKAEGSPLALEGEELGTFSLVADGVMVKEHNMYKPTPAVYTLLATKLLKWPKDKVFPVLDLMRLLIRNVYAAKYFVTNSADFDVFGAVASICEGCGTELPVATWLMCLRFFVNCFCVTEARTCITSLCAAVLSACKGAAAVRNANVETAYATLILDFAVSIREVGVDKVGSGYGDAISLSTELMKAATDPEASYRIMAAAGTLIFENDAGKAQAKACGMQDAAKQLASKHSGNQKITECLQQLLSLFN